MNKKMQKWLNDNSPSTPFMLFDTDIAVTNYHKLKYYFSEADIFYAVKANPGKMLLNKLENIGSNFDCASLQEIKMVLESGCSPDKISYGNTIKKEKDIKGAYDLGIRMFCFDSIEELEKISRSAPNSRVFCRILLDDVGLTADWPLTKKFGCEPEMAIDLLIKCKDLNLVPYGVSFHVGSQQKNIDSWRIAIDECYSIFQACHREDVYLEMINIGGGFPSTYKDPVESTEQYVKNIKEYINECFGDDWPRIIIEPGRSLVGDAGIIKTEVVLISKKSNNDFDAKWLYLDIGKFHGLAETMDESIKYRIQTPYGNDDLTSFVIAGPTCDSADVLYEKHQYQLSNDLKIGDSIFILSTGAYTTTYSSNHFNGFPPLEQFEI